MLRRRVQFGRTSHEFPVPASKKFVPRLFGASLFPSPNTAVGRTVLNDLEWLLQKDILGQDMCLIGAPGPYRRRLVSLYCELTQRELDTIVLSQDTSEPDLKQRRDLRDGSVVLTPQAPLRAAVLGRILLLDGIEKAERNVLPTLNNLLENREMNLLHGQRLVGPTHVVSDESAPNTTSSDPFAPKILKASPMFRCIALQLPVPTFPGQPIDPPLRSRFQGRICGGPVHLGRRRADANKTDDTAPSLRPELPYLEALELLRSHNTGRSDGFLEAYLEAMDWMQSIRDAKCSSNVPAPPFEALLRQAVNIPLEWAPAGSLKESMIGLVASRYPVGHVGVVSTRDTEAFEGMPMHGPPVTFADGEQRIRTALSFTQDSLKHFCIVGPKGCGKSTALWRALEAEDNHSAARVLTCYRDMSTRDLYQRRVIDDKGDSTWVNSPLVTAALEGAPVVLDGIHRCVPSVLASLAPLIHDGELALHSGERFMTHERFEALVAEEHAASRAQETLEKVRQRLMEVDRIFPVKPGFRIIGVAENGTFTHPWLNTESMTLFPGGFVSFAQPTIHETVTAAVKDVPPVHHEAVARYVSETLSALVEAGIETPLRFAQRLAQELVLSLATESDTAAALVVTSFVRRSLLTPFRPSTLRDAVRDALSKRQLYTDLAAEERKAASLHKSAWTPEAVPATSETYVWGAAHDASLAFRVGTGGPLLAINDRITRRELVPHVPHFHVLPSQMRLLQAITHDMARGHRSLLFIGNQGTGKNKLCDMLLSKLRLEREYFQLHRDTSVQSLTLTPSVQGRRLTWEYSPLLLAAIEGRVAVIDEADKAPLEVVVLLKALLSDEHLSLLDGRTLRCRLAAEPKDQPPPEGVLFIHDDFRAIVLANRPGYPFLGNDFFRECGDIFASHIVDNPDVESSLHLMESFAPSVPRAVLSRVASAFDGLRKKHEAGELPYPFSAREMVAVAKHMQAFPRASISAALSNITHFDQFNAPMKKIIDEVLEDHGLVLDDKPRVALGASADIMAFTPSPSLPFFVSKPTETCRFDAVQIRSEVLRARNVSNEIEQPWRNHTPNLPKFIPPRTYAFSELMASGTLPYAGTTYSKLPVAVVGVEDCHRRSPSSAEGNAPRRSRPGYLVVGAPTSLFVVDEDMSHVHEIDSIFAGGPFAAAVRQEGSDWILLAATASMGIFLLEISTCQLRKYNIPADLYAQRPAADPAARGVPVLNRLGNRFMNHEGVLTTFVNASGDVVLMNRTTGALVAFKANAAERDASCLTSQDALRALMDKLRAEAWDVAGSLEVLCASFDGSRFVGITFVVRHSTDVEKQLHAKCNINLLDNDTTATVAVELRVNNTDTAASIASAIENPFWSVTLVRATSDAGKATSATALTLYLRNQAAPDAVVSVPLPVGLVPVGHRITAYRGSAVGGTLTIPFTVTTIDEATDGDVTRGGFFGSIVIRSEGAALRSLSIRRVAFDPMQTRVAAVGHDTSASRFMAADIGGGLSVFEMSSTAINASLKDWQAQLSRDDAAGSDATHAADRVVTEDTVDGNTTNMTVEWQLAPPPVTPSPNANSNQQGDASANAGGAVVGSGAGMGNGAGGGFGGGSGGDGQGGSGSGGQGDDKQSDGLGGYSFDSKGDAVINARRRRQVNNVVKQALATGDVSYDRYLDAVADSVSTVALAIETLEAADKEREWLANNTFGELDDRRLVDAVVGEANVFMVRGVPHLPLGGPQRKPKYMDLVVDLSASMARFNAFDGRLDRICESLVLLMEAARGLEHKLVFEVHAHSGSAVRLPLLVCPSIYRNDGTALEKREDNPDTTAPAKAPVTTTSGAVLYDDLAKTDSRVKVVAKAVSHSRMAMTGDGTVEGLKLALANAAENVDADETFVVLVSDANLGGYGVSPKEIGDLMEQYRSQKVRCHVVFIAEQHAADWFTKQLPAGSASICTSTSEVPNVLLSIWSEALLDN